MFTKWHKKVTIELGKGDYGWFSFPKFVYSSYRIFIVNFNHRLNFDYSKVCLT